MNEQYVSYDDYKKDCEVEEYNRNCGSENNGTRAEMIQKIKESDEEGTYTNYKVNNKGQTTNIQFPNPDTKVDFKYDELGRLIESYNTSGLRMKATYDESGNSTNIDYYNNENNTILSRYKTEYNELGEIIKSTNPLNQSYNYWYDELGLIEKIKRPNGEEINYKYNNLNDLSEVTYLNDKTVWG